MLTVHHDNPDDGERHCRYCRQRMPDNEPMVIWPDSQVAHVACEIDRRAQGRAD